MKPFIVVYGVIAASLAAVCFSGSARAEEGAGAPQAGDALGHQHGQSARLQYIEPLPPITTEDENGRQVEYANERRWRPMCGSDTTNLTVDNIAEIAELTKQLEAQGPVAQLGFPGQRGAGLTVVLNVFGSPPAGAVDALNAVKAYIESQFSDPITITVNISFAVLSPGIIGQTGSDYLQNVSYSTIRTNLNVLDFDDTIQTWLPIGSSCPVRYDATSATVTNQSTIDLTEANWAAMRNITTAGVNGDTTFNSSFSFDYDPSNGVGGNTCFRSVAIHEIGHAMGFVSAADFNPNQMEGLDLFRFQFTDAGNDYNPDTVEEFQVRPRLVHNNNPNDSHHFDIISAEHRMEDGSPSQASHWRDNNGIGIMDPTLGGGETFFPNYFRVADIRAFDAIGFDYPPEDPGDVTPPTPNPMSFSMPPVAASPTSIFMQATFATDSEFPPAFYNFDYVSGSGGHDSGWQPSLDYTDINLLNANSAYTYRVAARDSSPNINQTTYSSNATAATGLELATGLTFGTITDTSIQVTADGTFTNLGLLQTGFFFEMTPPAGTGANVWVTGGSANTITVTGLSPCTQYGFRVKGRNYQGVEGAYNSPNPTMTGTDGCIGCSLLGDMNGNLSVEGGDIHGFVQAKLGTPAPGTFQDCANYGGTLETDVNDFVADLLGL